MVLFEKKWVLFLFVILFMYGCLFLAIKEFKLLNITNLRLAKYFTISVIFISVIFVIRSLSNSGDTPLKIVYKSCVIVLFLFLITSIFIFKLEDLFFWDKQKELSQDFFKFSFEISGWNYLLGFMYVFFFLAEVILKFYPSSVQPKS